MPGRRDAPAAGDDGRIGGEPAGAAAGCRGDTGQGASQAGPGDAGAIASRPGGRQGPRRTTEVLPGAARGDEPLARAPTLTLPHGGGNLWAARQWRASP